jgi:UDP-GlcNAc3NAcA epimerase
LKKIITIVGARPQFIKAAALSRAIRKFPEIEEIIVHTGQHFDQKMSDIFFEEMEIPIPKYNLNINGLSHGAMTGQMLEGIEKIIIEEKPDALVVYGDTNSTLAGSLAAIKLNIPVVHIEAGLRSFNMQMPEEINRILTDRISSLLCCPTDAAIANLQKEGFDNFNCKIVKTGDLMEDAAMYYVKIAFEKSNILATQNLVPNNYVLGTIHRAENTDNPENLKNMVKALDNINLIMPVIIPLHPRTKKIIENLGISVKFKIIDPVGYFDMINLIQNSNLVVTDSGGLQKEAFFFRKFCITTREQTEWIELVENGYNFIAGTNELKIVKLFKELSSKKFPEALNLYGNGNAAVEICKALLSL